MISIQDFRQERDSPASAYFQFCMKDTQIPDGIHVFLEGCDDRSFYHNFLRAFAVDINRIQMYKCGSKWGVYSTYRKVMRVSRRGTPLFFVDKDLSDILHEDLQQAPNIYVTDYYAIENYLVSDDMLFRVWTELFRFKNRELECGKTHREKFLMELERFHQCVLLIVAWIVYMKRNGKQLKEDKIKFSHFFLLNDDLLLEKTDEVLQNGEIAVLERICEVETPDGWLADSHEIIRELSMLDPKTYIRGKLELCFFVSFINKLVELLQRFLVVHGNEDGVSMKTALRDETAVEVLGPRLLLPQSLKRFLQQNLPEAS